MSNTTTKQQGIFASIKHVIIRMCSMLVKVVDEAEGTLDIVTDVRKTAKVHSSTLLTSTLLEADKEIQDLMQDLNKG